MLLILSRKRMDGLEAAIVILPWIPVHPSYRVYYGSERASGSNSRSSLVVAMKVPKSSFQKVRPNIKKSLVSNFCDSIMRTSKHETIFSLAKIPLIQIQSFATENLIPQTIILDSLNYEKRYVESSAQAPTPQRTKISYTTPPSPPHFLHQTHQQSKQKNPHLTLHPLHHAPLPPPPLPLQETSTYPPLRHHVPLRDPPPAAHIPPHRRLDPSGTRRRVAGPCVPAGVFFRE